MAGFTFLGSPPLNVTAAVLFAAFPFVPGFLGSSVIITVTGLLLGSQTLTNTITLQSFYGKQQLASALTMSSNFRLAGNALAPLIFSAFLDHGVHGHFIWAFAALMFFLAAVCVQIASVLIKKKPDEDYQ